METNIIREKSKAFALRIINLYKYLRKDRQEYVMSKQLLRSGTSIGANVRESKFGQSKPDFYSKLYIALKESEESAYWLELLHESEYLSDVQFQSIYTDCCECTALLVAITKNQKLFSDNKKLC